MKCKIQFKLPVDVTLEVDESGNVRHYDISEYFKVQIAQQLILPEVKNILANTVVECQEQGFNEAEIDFHEDLTDHIVECDRRLLQPTSTPSAH